MLQQTQVATVLRYFPAWMRRFPDVRALASAREADVLHAWQGLGYYSRARRLHEGARVVVERHAGRLPRDHAALLALPGIGAYSAGAIASIAFGERQPLVDGNVIRVLSRHFGLRGDPGKAPLKRELWRLAGELVPAERPGDFNQALMELGATVCTPRATECARCPLAQQCKARELDLVDTLPELPPRAKPTRVRVATVVVRDDRRVLLMQQPASAPRWAGLWTFPHVERAARESAKDAARRAARELLGIDVTVGARLASFEHTITRFRILLEAFEAAETTRTAGAETRPQRTAAERVERTKRTKRTKHMRRVRLDDLDALAMPTPHRKLARLLRSKGKP
jgi:A/G-specific adenine glycosylase